MTPANEKDDVKDGTAPIDVAIIGAGISGINTAYRVQSALPNASYTIFEGREVLGGTWSFFKYPGLRSDSDLFSFGFEWNPWQSDTVIADAKSILTYLRASIEKFGIDKHIKYQHKVVSLNWSSQEQLWEIRMRVRNNNEQTVKARWVVLGTGYYDYEKALPVKIPGLDNFKGQVVHPQFWPDDLNLDDKRVSIVGSGATAITILPNIAERARQVTIVQRSPSYINSLPAFDRSGEFLKRWLPFSWAAKLLRIKYLLLSFLFFQFCQRFPQRARKLIYAQTKKQLPKHISLEPHFVPRYGPWDQRLCLCPDGDFYAALRKGNSNIVTGYIENVTENKIIIKDQPDASVEADIIVTATGLKILIGGGATLTIDGGSVRIAEKMLWKGCMVQDIPNAIAVVGYTNASWTLGADVAAKTLTRLLAHLQTHSLTSATPAIPKGEVIKASNFMKMESTYLLKGRGDMPGAGDKYPWLPRGNYFTDMWDATFGSIKQDIVSKLFHVPGVMEHGALIPWAEQVFQ
ncbi:hypothetical protein EMMF5_003391 [Cystobasidiomycetes sp. EMM_F5]